MLKYLTCITQLLNFDVLNDIKTKTMRAYISSLSHTKRRVSGWTIAGIRYSAYSRPERYEVVFGGACFASFDKQRDAVEWAEKNISPAEPEKSGEPRRYKITTTKSVCYADGPMSAEALSRNKYFVSLHVFDRSAGGYRQLDIESFRRFNAATPYEM